MSWWTENRKKIALLGGLAALPFALPALGGLLGIGGAAAGAGAAGAGAAGAAGAGATGAGLGGLLGTAVGEGAVPMAAMAGDGAIAASQAMTPLGKAMSMGGSALKGLNAAGTGLQAASMFAPQQGSQRTPMPASPMGQSAPMPLSPLHSSTGPMMAPPGIDPNQWVQMSPEQKKALMAQRGMA